MRVMGYVKMLRARWIARRAEHAKGQIMAERTMPDPAAELLNLDAYTGSHTNKNRAFNRLLSPKVKSRTEWKGD